MSTGLRSLINSFPHKNIRIAGGLYLFYYFALGAFLPYIYLYYQKIGMTGIQIGVLAAVPVLVGAVASLIIGGLTDRYHSHSTALRVALILCSAAVFLLYKAKTLTGLILVVIVLAIFNSPIVPLLDSSAVEIAREHSRSYGGLRVWGSIGWAISTVLVGWLIQRLGFSWLFTAYIASMILGFFLSYSQPPRKDILQSSYLAGIKDLFKQTKFLLFLFSIFLVMVASGSVMAFFSIYMDSIGAGEGLIGWAWALSALSEMPFMALSGIVLRRIGSKNLLIISFSVYAVRWLILSFLYNPHIVLLLQLLHGPSFALMLVGSVNFINDHTPMGLNTSALAVFNTVAYGLGSMLGSLIGGYFDQNWSLTALFQVSSLLVTAGLLIFIASQRMKRTAITLK